MSTHDELQSVITGIYDAALGQADWTSTVAEIAALLGRGQACLEYVDYKTNEGRMLGLHGYNWPDVEEARVLYENDPWAHRLAWNFTGEFTLASVILSERERRSTFFVNDLAPLIGLETRDIHATFITRSCESRGARASVGALMIYSGENQETFGPEDMAIMALVRPHLVKALEVQSRLESASAVTSSAETVLDAMPSAFWVLDRNGRILFANAKAEAMQAREPFAQHADELRFSDPYLDGKLQRAIAATRSPAAFADRPHDGAFLAYSPAHARPLSVLVMPASPPTTASLITSIVDFPSVIVSISDQNPQLAPKLRVIQRLHGLTDAETRVLERFVEGASPAEIAEDAGLSVLTVRTQMRSIMAKTDTHSQRELATLVLTGVP